MSLTLHRQFIDRLRDFAAHRFGLNLDNGNRDRVVEALQRGVQRTGCVDAGLYVQRIEEGSCPSAEMAALVADLTVAETYFFRHPDQFRAVLDQVILPRLQEDQTQPRLNMLSAGCASGEEAYSLAILLDDHMPAAARLNVGVVGIDLNASLITKATHGRYTTWSLRGVPQDVQRRHFQVEGSEFVLGNSVRELVKFVGRNLVEDDTTFWQPAIFDVIFCRNVIMYFTPEAAQTVIDRLARSLAPGGLLFLGPAETLRGVSQDFHLQHTHETFYYQCKLTNKEAVRCAVDVQPATHDTNERLPLAIATDQSWVTTICRAAERVASLSRNVLVTEAQEHEPGYDLGNQRMATREVVTSHRLDDARQLVLEERFEEALGILQCLSSHESQNPDAQLLRAALLINSGRVREGDRLCQTVLDSDELNAEAHYLLALCREHAGEEAAAIEQDRMAIYLDSQFAMPHLHLGLLAKRIGDRAAAHRSFRQAATLLTREDASRIVLFGGGFDRSALTQLCQAEMRSNGDAS